MRKVPERKSSEAAESDATMTLGLQPDVPYGTCSGSVKGQPDSAVTSTVDSQTADCFCQNGSFDNYMLAVNAGTCCSIRHLRGHDQLGEATEHGVVKVPSLVDTACHATDFGRLRPGYVHKTRRRRRAASQRSTASPSEELRRTQAQFC